MDLSTLPDRRALRDPRGAAVADATSNLNNTEFLAAVRRAASALRDHGVSQGDVVAIKKPNCVDFVVSMFAAWRLGAAVTPVNPSLSPQEVDYQLADAGAAVLVSDGLSRCDSPSTAARGDEALALLIYTSGTTGRPKGVMLDHSNVNAMCRSVIDGFGLTSHDHSLLILPLFHVNGIVVGTLSPLVAGGRTTLAGRFDAASFFDKLERSRATYFSAVPTILTMLCGLPDGVEPDTSSVRFAVCGAAPASVELLQRFESRYRIPVVEGYGLSEGTCASTVNPLAGPRKPGTVGLPLPGQAVRIVDSAGAPVAHGEAGEVVIKGANVMRGYLNRPEETAKTVVDGWLHTGDIGRFDEDGYLILVDRAKDMIIRGGENIYPREIEVVVHQMPQIAEAAVVGRADATYGEVPVLYVSTQPGAAVTQRAIRDHIAQRLAKYKWPVEIHLLDSLPKNAVGKIRKPDLPRQQADSLITTSRDGNRS